MNEQFWVRGTQKKLKNLMELNGTIGKSFELIELNLINLKGTHMNPFELILAVESQGEPKVIKRKRSYN